MKTAKWDIVDDAAKARMALSPLRRELLERLSAPASASELGEQMNITRQKLGYHLKQLETAGLIFVAEERQRRGFVEKRYQSRAEALVFDPQIMGNTDQRQNNVMDRYASEHLIQSASAVIRDVTRMRAEADRSEKRLLTFTIEADVGFARPSDVESFTEQLAQAVLTIARQFDCGDSTSRPYRLTICGHPTAPKPSRKSS